MDDAPLGCPLNGTNYSAWFPSESCTCPYGWQLVDDHVNSEGTKVARCTLENPIPDNKCTANLPMTSGFGMARHCDQIDDGDNYISAGNRINNVPCNRVYDALGNQCRKSNHEEYGHPGRYKCEVDPTKAHNCCPYWDPDCNSKDQ